MIDLLNRERLRIFFLFLLEIMNVGQLLDSFDEPGQKKRPGSVLNVVTKNEIINIGILLRVLHKI